MPEKISRARLARPVLAVALLLATEACSDGGTPPEPRIDAVVILGGGTTVNLTVGDSVQLTASVGDDQGGAVTTATVAWRSTAEAVATVGTSGMVKGVGPGSAKVIASAEGFADTVDVSVQAAPVASCTGPLSIAVGEVKQVSAAEALCLGGTAGSDFVVVGFNGQASSSLNLTVQGAGASTSLSAPRGASFDMSMLPRRPSRDVGFELQLRHQERTELRRRLPGLWASLDRGGLRPRLSLSAATPAVGDLLTLNTNTEPGEACTNATRNIGRVAAVTSRAVIVSDTANPAGGFTDAEYAEIGATFDTLVWSVDIQNFGEPGDIDENGGRVIIFYTHAVNRMTDTPGSYVGGFFYARDLFPKTEVPNEFQACPGSNFAEMFYVLAPDSFGAANPLIKKGKGEVRGITLGTLAHELQHLILSSRRLYGLRTDAWDEETWLSEGLAHIAEELVFYRAAGLAPKMNVDSIAIRTREPNGTERRRPAFNDYGIDNFGRYGEYLLDPEQHSPYGADDGLENRGASWSFLRFVADRTTATASQPALWRKLTTSQTTGLANLRAAVGQEPIPLARDWAVSVFGDDFVPGISANYQQPSWDSRSVLTALQRAAFPLEVRRLANASTSIPLDPGGATYIRVTPSGSGVASLLFRSGGAAPPGEFSLMVIRTK